MPLCRIRRVAWRSIRWQDVYKRQSYDKLQEAEKTLKTTDDHLMMEAPLSFDVPEVDGDAAYCEDNYEETDANHWHYKEYLDWDEANDAKSVSYTHLDVYKRQPYEIGVMDLDMENISGA